MDDPRLKCHDLGFLEAARKPSPEELKSFYADSYYQAERGNYRKCYPPAERDYLNLKISQKAAIVSELRAGLTPGTMLDVGCGEGFALAWFQKNGWSVRGIDHSTAGLEVNNPNLLPVVRAGDIFALLDEESRLDTKYDLVWLTHVLEHVLDPVELLATLRRLVAADGVLVATVPNDGSAYQEALLREGHIPNRFWVALPDHLAYFTYDTLQCTAESTGWNCARIIGDFPIDLFLLHKGSNYVLDRSKGPDAHRARIQMELLLGRLDHGQVNDFYTALARVGLGRSLTAFLTPK